MTLKYKVNLLFDTMVTEAYVLNETIISVKVSGKPMPLELFVDYYLTQPEMPSGRLPV